MQNNRWSSTGKRDRGKSRREKKGGSIEGEEVGGGGHVEVLFQFISLVCIEELEVWPPILFIIMGQANRYILWDITGK